MSANKIKFQQETILDLTNKTITYDKVFSELNNIRMTNSYYVRSGIKIGKYTILFKPYDSYKVERSATLKHLLHNDRLSVSIKEAFGNRQREINASLMEDEPWFRNYLNSTFSIKELTKVILFCNRLESLTSFS